MKKSLNLSSRLCLIRGEELVMKRATPHRRSFELLAASRFVEIENSLQMGEETLFLVRSFPSSNIMTGGMEIMCHNKNQNRRSFFCTAFIKCRKCRGVPRPRNSRQYFFPGAGEEANEREAASKRGRTNLSLNSRAEEFNFF